MYGQGNYGQFPLGPPTQPPPPLQPAPSGPPPPPVIHHAPPPHPQSHQTPPGPSPLPYQFNPPAPRAPLSGNLPPPAPVNMRQPYGHRLPPPYAPPHPSYPPAMLSHGAIHVPPSVPQPPRGYPPPPPPPLPPLQGQGLYRIPPPLPSVQHVPTPPPPHPSGIVSIIPAPFSSATVPAEDAHPPSLPPPPPPPPPSSPPPVPPSPPAVAFPFMDKTVASCTYTVPKVHGGGAQEHVVTDAIVAPAQSIDHAPQHGTFPIDKAVNAEKEVHRIGESSQDLPSPPPKPIGEEVVRNIEVLCQFIAKIGPDFENMAREKEAGNPHFAFLYGGEPGSDAAVGYEYFQWMKKKCRLQMEPSKQPQQNSASLTPSKVVSSSKPVNVDNEAAMSSPASSDMDMEDDDGLLDGDSGHNKLIKELVADPAHVDNERHVCGEPSHALHNTKEQKGAMYDAVFHLDDKDYSFTKDISSTKLSPGVAVCAGDADVPKSARQVSEDASLVNVSSAAGGGKNIEVPRVFVKDGSPFRLIQGYASDDSGEEEKWDCTDISKIDPPSVHMDNKLESCSTFSSKNHPTVDIRSGNQDDSKKTSSAFRKGAVFGNFSLEKSASTNVIYYSAVEGKLDDKARTFEPSEDYDIKELDDVDGVQVGKQQPKDANQDSSKPNLDEFGRLVREGVSDSDSDGMQYNERCGKRGRSSSRSSSPRKSSHRWRSRSPGRRYNRNRSRSRSPRSKSPKAFRHTNLLTRRDRDQPPECFNFVRGRCFRGASCRFFHPDFGHNRSMQKIYRDPRQDSGKRDVNDHALHSERNQFATKMRNKFNNLQQKETVQTCSEQTESSNKTTKDGVGEKVAPGYAIDDALSRVGEDDLKQENTNQGLGNGNNQLEDMQQVNKFPEVPNLSHKREEKTAVGSDNPKPAKSLTMQSLPAGESKHLNEAVMEQHNQGLWSQSPLHQSHANYGAASQISTQHPPQEEVQVSKFSAPDSNSQLQPLKVEGHTPSLIPADNVNAPLASQQPAENLLPPVTVYRSQLSQSDMLHLNQPQIVSETHSQDIHTLNAMWPKFSVPSLSHANESPIRPSVTLVEYSRLQFHQNALPPRNDFSQPSSESHLLGNLSRSQAIHLNPQPSYLEDSSHQSPLHMTEHKSFPMGVQQDRPLGGDDRFPGPSLQHREYPLHHQSFVHEDVRVPLPGHGPSSFTRGSMLHSQALHLPRESFPSAQDLAGDILRPRIPPRQEYPSVKDLPYSNYQTSFAYQHHTSSSFLSTLDGPSMVDPSIQKIPRETSLPPQISGISIPKTSISMHYNPFASTFEQGPATLKCGTGVPGRGNDTDYGIKYDSSFSSGHGSVGGLRSKMTASPPNFKRSEEQLLPKIGGYALETSEVRPDLQKQLVKQPTMGALYDPLFDSIEPSSETLKLVHVHNQGQSAADAGPISKSSSLSRPLVVACNNEQKDGVGNELKSEVDDFGEVATDAEVGVVENDSPQLIDGKDWSPDMPAELANPGAGEIEIDQVHSTGKSKKTKDSRSTKHFKIALAEFVKEVLKPSWRQGNMSKEAFKTIVKKTVDKVSGSVPSHQIPKSQAKIKRYVESSQRKLTKLVMGYVDKYVKM